MRSDGSRLRPADAKLLHPQLDEVSLRGDAVAAFASAFKRRLTLVCAPAGYGKTTTTAAALDRLGCEAAWYKLDVLDHDPVVFLAAIVRALRTRIPGFGETLLLELEAGSAPDLPAESLAALFVSECEASLPSRHHLVLDDYHEAADSRDLDRMLSYLLANAPTDLHLVVLTRYEPGFPVEKMHLEGELARIDSQLLRFDADQVATVIEQRSGQRHDRAHIARLLTLTEGWPASVVLAGMALTWLDAASLESALADPRLKTDMYSYLAEQVFQREAADVQAFLLRTCCLEHITLELAELLAPAGDAHRHLRHLSSNSVFTFVADRQGAFRYHNLFRDFLRQRVVQDDGERAFHALQLDTAVALEAAGDSRRAVELLLTANSPGAALDVIARAGEAGLERCTTEQLSSWLKRIRPALTDDRPWALVLSGALGGRDGSFGAALSDLRRACGLLEQADDAAGLYEALSITECTEFWADDPEACIETCHRALPLARTDAQRLHTLLSLLSAALDMRMWDEVESASRQAAAFLPHAQPDEIMRAQALRAHAAFYQGDVRSARRAIIVSHHPGQTVGLQSAALNTHGMIEMALGEYDDAARLLREAAETSARHGHAAASYMIRDNIAFLRACTGAVTEGLESLEALCDDDAGAHEPTLLCFTLSHQASVLRRCGRVEASLEPGRRAAQAVPAGRDPYLALNAATNLAFAEGLLGEPRHRELARLTKAAAMARLSFVELKGLLYEGILLFAAGQRRKAVEQLEACLPRQLALGHINLVAQEVGPRADVAAAVLRRNRSNGLGPPLLDALSRHWQFAKVAEQLRRDCPSEVGTWLRYLDERRPLGTPVAGAERRVATRDGRAGRRVAAMGDGGDARDPLAELTRRERQVLELIAEDRTNAEIAQDLFLALPTVKTHITRILRKLGQTTRVGAVLEYHRAIGLIGRSA